MSDSASKLVCNVSLKAKSGPHVCSLRLLFRVRSTATRAYELRLLLEGLEEDWLPMALSQLHTKFITSLCGWKLCMQSLVRVLSKVRLQSDYSLSNRITAAYLGRGSPSPIHAYHDDDDRLMDVLNVIFAN